MYKSTSNQHMKNEPSSNQRLERESSASSNEDPMEISKWLLADVECWLDGVGLAQYKDIFSQQHIDGLALALLTEEDLKCDLNVKVLGDVKKLCSEIGKLKHVEPKECSTPIYNIDGSLYRKSRWRIALDNTNKPHVLPLPNNRQRSRTYSSDSQGESIDRNRNNKNNRGLQHDLFSQSRVGEGRATNLKPEYLKTIISCFYMVLVTWITAVVMVYVHDRVPDKARHPPLPDIFLDNVPLISWAFHLCEIAILILTIVWFVILFFHRHRSILWRRFCALSGSVFLLRCATMFITSLSVPGHHLECSPREEEVDFWTKVDQAWIIWRGGGLSIKGVRTCGDYMFSGHTTALTLLNFFITEYTPRRLYFLHIVSWVLNTFGIFFILAAHEHYSIDVFIAFYITSRMFLYYHSLANNRALHQRDAFRTKIWFPMFSYFEFNIDGIVPNEYTNPLGFSNFKKLWRLLTRTAWSLIVKLRALSESYNCAKKKKKLS